MSEELSIREARLQSLAKMRELGFDPFAVERWERPHTATELLEQFEEGKPVSFAGRIVSYRDMGKAGFAHLSDGDGRIQGYFRKDDLGDDAYAVYKLLDLGDHVGVEGELFLTKTGERSIHVKRFHPLSKTLEAVPLGKQKDGKVFSGLADKETRFRHRHLDLLTGGEGRRALVERAKIVAAVRRYFDGKGYLEVETPLLQLEAGGAAATPFVTHYNAYETDVKLRISLELYLKRLICGDLPRVYEVGRVFRNEKVSNRHNPEFTLLEFYEAYTDLEGMMSRVEECFRYVARSVYGTEQITVQVMDDDRGEDEEPKSYTLDFGKPWKRVDLLSEIERLSGIPASALGDLESAKAAIGPEPLVNPSTGKRIVASEEHQLGGLIEKLLEVFVEPTLQEPTFVVGYPLETSPLAKKDPSKPGYTRRFEGYVFGREVCNAFSEINDPVDQRERFEAQVAERAKGDEEAHPMDEDFLYALECGMPPTGGCGIGIDRMAMLFTGASHIRHVLYFPFMKPEGAVEPAAEED